MKNILLNNNLFFILYLGALSAFAPFSTDIYLASMPLLQVLFHTSAFAVQLTLSLFFVAFAVCQLIWGPLSDRLGRKPVVFIGVSLFLIGSICCALSQGIGSLIFFRIIQAIGACSGIVMAIAMVKDNFAENKIPRILSIMMSIAMLAPMIAPIIGSYLLTHFSWVSNFYFLAIYGFLLILGTFFIHETHPKESRKPLPINKLVHVYQKQFKNSSFLLATLASSTNFSAVFGFISSSSFIYIAIYHVKPAYFGYFFAFNALALILGSISINIFRKYIKPKQLVLLGIITSLLGSMSMLLCLSYYPNNIISMIIPAFILTYGVGILMPELTALALKHVVLYTGIASSLLGTLRFLLAAFSSFLMGILIKSSAFPLAMLMITMNLLTAIIMFFYFYRNKR